MKKLKFVSLLALLWLTGCQSFECDTLLSHYEASEETSATQVQQITEDVTLAEVKNILVSLFGADPKGRASDYTLTLLKDDSGSDAVICINFNDNKGYALLSAVKTHNPVLAYSKNGNFDATGELPYPLSEWMNMTIDGIESSGELPTDSLQKILDNWNRFKEYNPLSLKSRTEPGQLSVLTWDEYYAMSQIMMQYINEWNRAGYKVYAIDDYTGTTSLGDKNAMGSYVQNHINPLYADDYKAITLIVEKENSGGYDFGIKMPVHWHQYDGYNQSFAFSDDHKTGHIPVGCGVVALGQIMRAYKYPDTFDWDAMTLSGTGNKVTSDFLLDVFNKCGAYYDYNKHQTASDVNGRLNALNTYGYDGWYVAKSYVTQNTLINHSPAIVESTFNLDSPHAWVVSGGFHADYYRQTEIWSFSYENQFYCLYEEQSDKYLVDMFNVNWGFDDQSDGYYEMSNMLPRGQLNEYKSNTINGAIINIVPDK